MNDQPDRDPSRWAIAWRTAVYACLAGLCLACWLFSGWLVHLWISGP